MTGFNFGSRTKRSKNLTEEVEKESKKWRTDLKRGREKAVMNFVNVVFDKEKPLTNPSEAVILSKVIDAFYESAKS